MAQLGIAFDEQPAEQTSTSATPVTVLSSDATKYVAGGKYLLVASAAIGGNHVTNETFEHQLTHGGTLFPGSDVVWEPTSTTTGNLEPYGWIGEYTQPGGGAVDIDQEHNSDGTDEVRSDNNFIIGIPVGGFGANYAYGEDDDVASPVTNSGTTFQARATTGSLTVEVGDIIAVLASVTWNVENAGKNFMAEIDADSGTQLALMQREGEASSGTGRDAAILFRYFVATSTAHTFNLRVRDDSTSGAENDHVYSAIAAWNVTKTQKQVGGFYDASDVQAVSQTLEQAGGTSNNVPVTWADAGDVLMLGYSSHDADSANRNSQIQLRSGAAGSETEIPTGWEAPSLRSRDPSEDVPMFAAANETVSAAARSYEMWVRAQNTAATKDYNSFLVISHELLSAGPEEIALAGDQPNAAGALALLWGVVTLAGAQPAGSSSLAAVQVLAIPLAGAQPAGSSSLGLVATIALAGTQPATTGALTLLWGVVGLTGNQPNATSILVALQVLAIPLAGAQPAGSSVLALTGAEIALAGNQPASTGSLAVDEGLIEVPLAGAQPAGSSTLAVLYLIALAGDQPNATSALTALQVLALPLAGNQPNATSALDVLQILAIALAGSQPAGSSSLLVSWVEALAGNQPNAAAALVALQVLALPLAGNQPASTGDLVFNLALPLAGNQPNATAALVALQVLAIALAGNQPAASSTLALAAVIALAGNQPNAAAALVALSAAALAAEQAAPWGVLNYAVQPFPPLPAGTAIAGGRLGRGTAAATSTLGRGTAAVATRPLPSGTARPGRRQAGTAKNDTPLPGGVVRPG